MLRVNQKILSNGRKTAVACLCTGLMQTLLLFGAILKCEYCFVTTVSRRPMEGCVIRPCTALIIYTVYKCEVKVIPLQARCGPDGG